MNVGLDNCTNGNITRTWTVTDPTNNQFSCTQTIVVYHFSDFAVEFPEDFTAECSNGDFPDIGNRKLLRRLRIDRYPMRIRSTITIQVIAILLQRTWTVVNWCLYDNYGYNAYYEYPECNWGVDFDGDGDQDCHTYRDGWNWTGNPGVPDGFIMHTQVINVIDNEAPAYYQLHPIDGCIVGATCNKDLILPYPEIFDQCSLLFDVDIIGDFGVYSNITSDVLIPNVGIGKYEVTYAVTDYCGNTGYQTFTIVVEDCSPPTPQCLPILEVELPCSGLVEVFASELDNGSFDNCGPITYFTFTTPTY